MVPSSAKRQICLEDRIPPPAGVREHAARVTGRSSSDHGREEISEEASLAAIGSLQEIAVAVTLFFQAAKLVPVSYSFL